MKSLPTPFFKSALCAIAMAITGPAALADTKPANYPVRPVRLIVPFPAGGTSDIVARAIADRVAAAMGQPWVIENRPGAGAAIGTAAVAKSAPDGYTLLLGAAGPISMSPHITKVSYDVDKDLAPVALIASVPNVVCVYPGQKLHSLKDLVALSRDSHASLNYASAGNGTTAHFAGELFKSTSGGDALHIPYKGTSAAITDLIAGQVQFSIDNLPAMLPFIKSGQLTALAVTSESRSPALPDVPTTAEAGLPGLIVKGWFGFFAPKNTPPQIVDYLAQEIMKISNQPETQAALKQAGAEMDVRGPSAFASYYKADSARWGMVASKSQLKGD
jgi:tripartite-type tricarboxylate transporter receptor subunit TctC